MGNGIFPYLYLLVVSRIIHTRYSSVKKSSNLVLSDECEGEICVINRDKCYKIYPYSKI